MQRAVAIVGAFALAFFCLTTAVVYADGASFEEFTADPLGTVAHAYQNALGLGRAAGDESPVADDLTLDDWQDYMNASVATNGTANVGRIWTDKSVSTGNITLDPNGGTINKEDSSDFLVALSALSSTSNKVTYTDKPLDIVLVLDLSASMTESIGYSEVYADDLDTGRDAPTYYVQVNGDYREIEYENQGSWWEPDDYQWGYYTRRTWHQVDPKTSADDSNGDQVYVEKSKLEALKDAVDQFIDNTDAENDSMPADSKHRVSIVTFSEGANTRRILTDCDGQNATSLKGTVDGLTATGGTRADLGLEQAQNVLNGQGARDDAQKVVIFFTDGQPGYYQFEDALAGDAVNTARDMKADGATIFSIGVFDGASNDPVNNGTSDFNRYMHAVSSNYKEATCPEEYMGWASSSSWGNYDYTYGTFGDFGQVNLGQRTPGEEGEENPQYYYAADSSESLNEVFENIAQNMDTGSVGVPTRVDSGFNMGNDGYITFTDTLGAYMEVNPDQDFTVVYKNTHYTAKYDAENRTYTMPNMPVEGNYADKDENLTNINQILISVEKSDNYALEGDTVTVKVPASLIPLLHYSVTTENGETIITSDSEETFPIRALYGVKVVDNIDDIMIEQLADEDSALNNYLDGNGNTSADGTQAYLYSNNWQRPATADGTTATGSTTATFEPSTKNAFYYFQEDTPVYTDEACTQPARQDDLSGDGSLYYKFTYDVAGTDGEGWYAIEVPVSNFVNHPDYYGVKRNYDQLNNDEIVNGQVYIKTGMPRLSRVNDFDTAKADGANKTNTATQVLRPSWTNNDQAVSVALGNNGRIAIEMPGSLAISKNVETPEGFPTDDVTYHEGVDFEFKIHVDGASGEYTAAIAEDGKTTPIDGGITFSDSGDATYKLHDGQQLIIYGLDNGADYTVTETEKAGYEATSEGAAGTIKAAETAQVAFTNTYKVTSTTVTGSTDLKGTKSIDGRAWVDGESYVFYLAQLAQGNPMPKDAENGRAEATVTGDSSKGEDAIGFNFGDIEFKTPGVYNYTIQEDASKSDDMPGVTQSQAAYRVQITVADNHDGSLKATVKMFQSRTDDNTVIDEADWTETDTAAFVNRYEVGVASAPIYATKAITDEVGSNKKVENGDYRFILEPAGDTAETAPMPANATGEGASRQALSVNQGGSAAFSIPFTNDNFPAGQNEATFWYKLTEDSSYEPIPGMEYSTQEYFVKVTFERSEDADGGALIKPTVTYYTDADGTQPADNNQALFTNTFDPDDVTLGEDGATDIHGTRPWTAATGTATATRSPSLRPRVMRVRPA